MGEAFNTPRVLISGFPTHRTILLYRHLARPLVATRFRDLRGTRVVAKQEPRSFVFVRCNCALGVIDDIATCGYVFSDLDWLPLTVRPVTISVLQYEWTRDRGV